MQWLRVYGSSRKEHSIEQFSACAARPSKWIWVILPFAWAVTFWENNWQSWPLASKFPKVRTCCCDSHCWKIWWFPKYLPAIPKLCVSSGTTRCLCLEPCEYIGVLSCLHPSSCRRKRFSETAPTFSLSQRTCRLMGKSCWRQCNRTALRCNLPQRTCREIWLLCWQQFNKMVLHFSLLQRTSRVTGKLCWRQFDSNALRCDLLQRICRGMRPLSRKQFEPFKLGHIARCWKLRR